MFYSTKSRIGSGLSDVKRRVFPEKHLEETIYKVAELFNVPEKLVKDNLPEITHGKGRYYPKENKISTTGNISEDIENSASFLRAVCMRYAGKGYPSPLEIMISRFFGEIACYPSRVESPGKKHEEFTKQKETLHKLENVLTRISDPSQQISDVIKDGKELIKCWNLASPTISNYLLLDHGLQILAYHYKERGLDLYEEIMRKNPKAIFEDTNKVVKLLVEILDENRSKLSN